MNKIKILLILCCVWLCCSGYVIAQSPTVIPDGQVTLTWDANTESDLEGYQVHYGDISGVYDTVVNVGNLTTYTIKDLIVGKNYYFVLTAYDTSKNESGYSIEVSGDGKDRTSPAIPSGFREVIQEITIKVKTVNIITK